MTLIAVSASNVSIVSPNITFVESASTTFTKSLTFASGLSSIIFTLKSAATDTKVANIAKVNFTIGGTNKDSYNAISDGVVNTIDGPTAAPKATLAVTSYAGRVKFDLTCDQSSIGYIAFAEKNATIAALNWTSLQAATLNINLNQTRPDITKDGLV